MLLTFFQNEAMQYPSPIMAILVFFTYSFLGYIIECIVLSVGTRSLVLNRGFTGTLPLCIIYGFGAMIGFMVLSPFRHNLLLLFVVGAVFATTLEYMAAKIQIRLFGAHWWDYSKKPFNYKGILCLESTICWGFGAILVVHVLHRAVMAIVSHIPYQIATVLAVALVTLYVADFLSSARRANSQKENINPAELKDYKQMQMQLVTNYIKKRQEK